MSAQLLVSVLTAEPRPFLGGGRNMSACCLGSLSRGLAVSPSRAGRIFCPILDDLV